MVHGPGKYDDACATLLEAAQAEGEEMKSPR
ncbi:hypothetical protein BCh11DRAFT_03713 [Burkholderia sp. Ch1-1]|nr:hypothetical protein BCh11DRAFT_03713 [Burkholderia sp. Ch1-1]